MMSRLVVAAMAVASAVFSFHPAVAALVGTFTAEGQTITAPLAFDRPVFNSVADIQGGLSFAIAGAIEAPVKLEVLAGTENVTVVAAALENAFGISRTLPLSITSSEPLGAGVHPFAIGAVTEGGVGGAIIARLTLTPIPGSLLLLGPVLAAGVGWNFARRPLSRLLAA